MVVHHLAGTVTDLLLEPCFRQQRLDAKMLVDTEDDEGDIRPDSPPYELMMD